jgi:hypothetical protein
MTVFKRGNLSLWPIHASLLNVPLHKRHRPEFIFMLGLMAAKPKSDMFLRIILQEFVELYEGVQMHPEVTEPVRAMILWACTDYRAHSALASCTQHPAIQGACDKCGQLGTRAHGTTVYRDYFR